MFAGVRLGGAPGLTLWQDRRSHREKSKFGLRSKVLMQRKFFPLADKMSG
jgi:hypothetical protein